MPETNQQDPKVTDAQSEKLRSGAPDGSEKKRRSSIDGREPLEFPGQEAIAQFFATPESQREFDSITALAKHFDVSRTTVYRWAQDIDVLRRMDWLSLQHKVTGKLIIRCEWAEIMKKLVDKAKNGDVRAIKECADLAWREDKHGEESHLSTMTIEELIALADEDQEQPPSWLEGIEDQEAAARKAAEENRALEEPKEKPE